jgi:hypothetical protein
MRGLADQFRLGVAAEQAKRFIDPHDATSPLGDQYRVRCRVQCPHQQLLLIFDHVPSDGAGEAAGLDSG